MNRNYVLLLAPVVMLFSSCASTGTKDIVVAAQADPKVDFNGYKRGSPNNQVWAGKTNESFVRHRREEVIEVTKVR
jgi:hypothetical protein